MRSERNGQEPTDHRMNVVRETKNKVYRGTPSTMNLIFIIFFVLALRNNETTVRKCFSCS